MTLVGYGVRSFCSVPFAHPKFHVQISSIHHVSARPLAQPPADWHILFYPCADLPPPRSFAHTNDRAGAAKASTLLPARRFRSIKPATSTVCSPFNKLTGVKEQEPLKRQPSYPPVGFAQPNHPTVWSACLPTNSLVRTTCSLVANSFDPSSPSTVSSPVHLLYKRGPFTFRMGYVRCKYTNLKPIRNFLCWQ